MDRMQVICTLHQTNNYSSTSLITFLQARCTPCCPTNSVKALKAYQTHSGIFTKQFQMRLSHQVFGILADVIPLWTCKAVLSLHDHPYHYQLLAMPEWWTANKPVPTPSVLITISQLLQPFYDPLSGNIQVSWYQKDKLFWILLKQR